MRILEYAIAVIQAFRYTETEARFLYIVATHSGYFVPRQFLEFSSAKWGYRTNHFTEKLQGQGRAYWRSIAPRAASTTWFRSRSTSLSAKRIAATGAGIPPNSSKLASCCWISFLQTKRTTTSKPSNKRSATFAKNSKSRRRTFQPN